MEIEFFKYQGTGNDFIMIDGRESSLQFSQKEIADICNRRFGIGADGLIILKKIDQGDFEMDYYNADGSKSFCGNGSRCAQAFARQLGLIKHESTFLAIDGWHKGKSVGGEYATRMNDVPQSSILSEGEHFVIDTGSPHYIVFCENLDEVDVVKEGRKIRNSPAYKKAGINVNFVEQTQEGISVRTYERGVEDETFSCGTGVTAAAIAHNVRTAQQLREVKVLTKGGKLRIKLESEDLKSFHNLWLIGPAEFVFEGKIKR